MDLKSLISPVALDGQDHLQAAIARLVTGEPVAALLQDTLEEGLRKTLLAVVARDKLYTSEEVALGLCQIFERMRTPVRQSRLTILQRLLEESIRKNDIEKQRSVLSEQKHILSLKREIDSALRSGDIGEYCALARQEGDLKAI